MQYFRGLLFALGVSFGGLTFIYGQQESNSSDFSKDAINQYAEKRYGLDDLLVNGIRYQPERINVNGSPDFEYDESAGISLFIKGQPFFNVDLKYDITVDQLILIQPLENGYERQVMLQAELVDSFYLGSQLFINLGKPKENSLEHRYFEKVFSGNELFLIKYQKTYIKIYDSSNKGRYSPQQSTYYIYNQGSLIKVNSKKSFLSFYAGYKKEIREFMRENGIRYRKASNEELKKLMAFCYAKSIQNS